MWGMIPFYYSLDQNGNLLTPQIGTRMPVSQLCTGSLKNWDMSLFKNIPIRERYNIQLRLEAYNILNHPNFQDKFYPTGINNGAALMQMDQASGPTRSHAAEAQAHQCSPSQRPRIGVQIRIRITTLVVRAASESCNWEQSSSFKFGRFPDDRHIGISTRHIEGGRIF
jgi:hypothetical protein